MGRSFAQLKLFFHKVSHITKRLFPHLRQTLCADRPKLCWSVGSFHSRCFSTRRLQQNGVFGVHPSGGQKDESGRVLNQDCKGTKEKSPPHCCNYGLPCAEIGVRFGVVMLDEDLIHLLFGRNIRIQCFNFFNICTYRTYVHILHCYCADHTRLNGAPIILM